MYLLLLGLLSSCLPGFLNPPGVRVFMDINPTIPLSSDAELRVQISEAGPNGRVLVERVQKSPGPLPVNLFFVGYDPAKLDPKGQYAVSASIHTPGGLHLQSQNPIPVVLDGRTEYIKLEAIRTTPPIWETLKGRILLPNAAPIPATARLQLQLVEVGGATMAEQTYPVGALRFGGGFSLDYDRTLLSPIKEYAVVAALHDDGKVVYSGSQAVDWPVSFGVSLLLKAVSQP